MFDRTTAVCYRHSSLRVVPAPFHPMVSTLTCNRLSSRVNPLMNCSSWRLIFFSTGEAVGDFSNSNLIRRKLLSPPLPPPGALRIRCPPPHDVTLTPKASTELSFSPSCRVAAFMFLAISSSRKLISTADFAENEGTLVLLKPLETGFFNRETS